MSSRIADYDARRALEKQRKERSPWRNAYDAGRAAKVDKLPCRVCGTRSGIEAHHIVPRSNFARRNPDAHHPDNLMPLCHRHHQDHHTTTRGRVPRYLLTERELQHAIERKGEPWVEKWYPVS